MIVCDGLTKIYRRRVRVENVSFEARTGEIVGLVGPNGAGKTTTLRLLLGLTRPSQGSATIAGQCYRDLVRPLRTVGVLLDDVGIELALSPHRLLKAHARSNRLPMDEVAHVLAMTGLTAVAGCPIKEFSLGMRKRVGLALALLGRPSHLIIDEPLNGLDPPSIIWLRQFLRRLADEGCCIVVASHVLAEQERLCDCVVVMDSGRVIAQGPTADLVSAHAPMRTRVEVAPEDQDALAAALDGLLLSGPVSAAPGFWLAGDQRKAVGQRLLSWGIAIHDLTVVNSGLEGVFERLVSGQQEFRMGGSAHSKGAEWVLETEKSIASVAAPRRAA